MPQDKAKILARATRKFMGCANRLVGAAVEVSRHRSGSRGLARANELG